MPLFGESGRTSSDFFDFESESKESEDDRLDSPKSGMADFFEFSFEDRLDLRKNSTKKRHATFWRVRPNVLGFVRFGIRGERIRGRWAGLAKKWHVGFVSRRSDEYIFYVNHLIDAAKKKGRIDQM